MKNTINIKGHKPIHYLTSLWSMKAWQTGLKSRPWLLGRVNRIVFLVIGYTSHTYAGAAYRFVEFCIPVVRRQGLRGLAIYLKACSVLLQNAVAGRKIGCREFGVAVSVTRSGLPRVIPLEHRRYIRGGAVGPLRLWLTLFMLYRVIDITTKVNIDTILLPFSGTSGIEDEWNRFMGEAARLLRSRSRVASLVIDKYHKLRRRIDPYIGSIYRPLMTSGPNSVQGSVAMCNVEKDALALYNSPIWPSFNSYCTEVESMDVTAVVRTAAKNDPSTLEWPHYIGGDRLGALGRVSFKREPGKVRVFAMLDYWSQSALRGVHEFLLKLLGSLNHGSVRLDGTFDQGETVQYLLDSCSRGRKFYSFDLSAATDRFPVWAQWSIMKVLFGESVANHWRVLLVGRGYAFPAIRPGKATGQFSDRLTVPYGRLVSEGTKEYNQPLYYAVGQPMGAHSSWPAFTLAHHLVVQWAANRVGKKEWFEDYGILGDDLVIFDKFVAAEYLKLIRRMGVNISLSKSLPGVRKCFEFAKRFVAHGADCSPLSFREFAVFNRSLSGMVEMVNRASSAVKLRPASVLRGLGFGFKSTGRLNSEISGWPVRFRRVVVALLQPGAAMGVKHWEAWVSMRRIQHLDFIPQEGVPRLLQFLHESYVTEIEALMKLFDPVKARVEELLPPDDASGHLGDYGEDPELLVRSICVEKPILEAILKRLEEIQSEVLDLQTGSLSDAAVSYQGLIEELSSYRPCVDMFARAEERDPKLVFKGLRAWEDSRSVVDKALGGGTGLVCRRRSRKKARPAKRFHKKSVPSSVSA